MAVTAARAGVAAEVFQAMWLVRARAGNISSGRNARGRGGQGRAGDVAGPGAGK